MGSNPPCNYAWYLPAVSTTNFNCFVHIFSESRYCYFHHPFTDGATATADVSPLIRLPPQARPERGVSRSHHWAGAVRKSTEQQYIIASKRIFSQFFFVAFFTRVDFFLLQTWRIFFCVRPIVAWVRQIDRSKPEFVGVHRGKCKTVAGYSSHSRRSIPAPCRGERRSRTWSAKTANTHNTQPRCVLWFNSENFP